MASPSPAALHQMHAKYSNPLDHIQQQVLDPEQQAYRYAQSKYVKIPVPHDHWLHSVPNCSPPGKQMDWSAQYSGSHN